jgi:putative ABC transport system ATP-binding protein
VTRAYVIDDVAHSVPEGLGEKPTLAPISRRFEPGSFHVVSGPSGAGKTTLLSILWLSVRPARGAVRWRGDDLTLLDPAAASRWRRANLGMVFQASRLVGAMSVADHIILASRIRHDRSALDEGHSVLQALGMSDKLAHRPHQLSGGEKQRVAIAQAMAARPAVLLADEPTAALDSHNSDLVANILRDYARRSDAVVICVSHDAAVINSADELHLLNKP